MKKLLLGSILVLILLVVVTVLVQRSPDIAPEEEYTELETPPIDEKQTIPDANTTFITTESGVVEIFDIRNLSSITRPGDGFYHLRGKNDDSNAPFSLLYSELDNSFSIAIEAEPVEYNLQLASNYFVQLLQISEVDACKLNVFIGVPYSVNPTYQGKRLRLPYCVALPLRTE